MAYIDELVNVSISLASGGLSKAAFGVPNFASYHPYWTDRIKFYGSTAAVALDFPTTSPEYLASVAYFSQTPTPTSMAISRLEIDAITVDVVGSAVYDDTFAYSIDINGNGPYTSTGAGSAILTATAIVAAASGDPDTDFVDNADGTYDITIKVSPAVPAPFILTSLDAKQGWIVKTAGETWTDGLIAVRNSSNAWYALAINSRVEADVLLAAAWTQTNKKLYLTASNDLEIINTTPALDTGSIADQLATLGYTRTGLLYHSQADGAALEQWIELAFFGENLTVDLDVQTSTWAFSQLVGITADSLTDSQIQNAIGTADAPTTGKNVNIYIPVSGADIIQRGQVVEGEWIDTVIGVDWIEARIQEGVYSLFINTKQSSKKVPLTDKGTITIPNEIIKVLKTGQDTELLGFDSSLNESLGFLVTWPLKADVSAADRAARYLRNVTFTATLAGAIHATSITGTIGV